MNWEKEFGKFYGAMFECGDFEELMSKIKSLLFSQRQEIIEEIKREVEGRKKEIPIEHICNRPQCLISECNVNQTLSGILNYLEELKKKI